MDFQSIVVEFTVDYSFPVEQGREALQHILEATDLWDGRDWSLQVTDFKGHAMELRVVATARDASEAWSLRCYLREKLIEFIQKNHPQSLPQLRTRPLEEAEEKGIEVKPAPPLVVQPNEKGLP